MKDYNYVITTKKIIPPIGGVWNYAGILQILVHTIPERDNEIIKVDFGETYGKTQEEAYGQMESKVKQWIAKHEK